MEAKRNVARKLLAYFSRVFERKSGTLLGYLVDMTTGGMLIVGNYPLKVNSDFELRIDLPEGYDEKERLDIEARAMWCLQDPDPELYRTGMKLVEVSPKEFQMLVRIITDYGLNKRT